jgi:exosome complex component CSL4
LQPNDNQLAQSDTRNPEYDLPIYFARNVSSKQQSRVDCVAEVGINSRNRVRVEKLITKFHLPHQDELAPQNRKIPHTAMATKTAPSIAIPGQLLGPTSKYQPGPGTHIYESNLYSSLLGLVQVTQPAKPPGPAKRLNKITPVAPAALPTISVSPSGISDKREVLPEVGNVVLCRVVRIMPRQAVVTILICGDTVLEAEWQGVIRAQDVRATEKDKVKIYESFRPGDIVRAEVVSHFFTNNGNPVVLLMSFFTSDFPR